MLDSTTYSPLFGEPGSGWCVLPLILSWSGIRKHFASLDEDVPVRVVIILKMILIQYINSWKSLVHEAIPFTAVAETRDRQEYGR